jgi:ribonuclease-3 family protein
MVRERLLKSGGIPPEQLHLKALRFVRAVSQSKAVENLLPVLTEFETEIYKRGRNAKGRSPKSSSVAEYRRATGMECLFGYIYLAGDGKRLSELFEAAFADIEI